MLNELGRIIVCELLLLPVVSCCFRDGEASCLFLVRVTKVVGSGLMSAVRSFSSRDLNCFGPLDGSIGDSLS